MIQSCRAVLAAIIACGIAQPAAADVITDWNEKAVAFVLGRNMGPPPAERVIAMVHVAMFDAVNSIERRYRPYLVAAAAPRRPPRRRPRRLRRPARCSPARSADAGRDEGRARGLSRRRSPTATPRPKASGSAKRSRRRSWRRARMTARGAPDAYRPTTRAGRLCADAADLVVRNGRA